LAVLVLLSIVPHAAAFTTRFPKLASFGSDGTAGTTLNDRPMAAAFDQAGKRLYVVNRNPAASRFIYGFDVSTPGTYAPLGGNFPIPIAATGNFPGLAVDDTGLASAGNIYFLNDSQRKVYGFEADGTPLGGNFPFSIPAAGNKGETTDVEVDSAGSVLVVDRSSDTIKRFDPLGNPLGSPIDLSSISSQKGFAFDSSGDLFVASDANVPGNIGGVWKLEAPAYGTAIKIDFSPTNSIAIDTGTDTLYVAHPDEAVAYDTDSGDFLYEFARDIPGADFTAIVVDQAADAVYIADNGTGNDRVHVFGPAQDFAEATVALTPASEVTDTTAKIGLTIDDKNALPTNWRLELTSNGGESWSTIFSGKTAGGETGALVSETVTGLDPNSGYRFRAVTNKGLSPQTEAVSSEGVFATVAPPPVVTDVGAIQVADTSARLVGTIDPRNTEAGYVFEYGLTPALGSSTAPLAIGGGTTPITVSQVIGGLMPSTPYYFRLVATNMAGTTTGTSHSFTTRAQPLPNPTDRAYEQVTPPEKNYTDAENLAGVTTDGEAGVSLDGNTIGFCTTALFGDPAGQMTNLCAHYISRRTPGGWQTANPFPAYCHADPTVGSEEGSLSVFPSPDFSRAIIRRPESPGCPIPPLDPSAPLTPSGGPAIAHNLYLQDLLADPPGFQLLNPEPGGAAFGEGVQGGSEDFSHVVYHAMNNQTAEPDSPPPGDFEKVYEWGGGALRLVSKDLSGEPFETSSSVPVLGGGGNTINIASAVSRDGERIYFQNPVGGFLDCVSDGCELYMREGGAVTHHVSASECTVSCGSNRRDEFLSATPSGEVAFFASCARLTDASGPPPGLSGCEGHAGENGRQFKLYRWNGNEPPGARLVDLTVDEEPLDGVIPDIHGLVGHSEDGETAYFVATGQLVAGESAVDGDKLYRWRWNGGSPIVDYLGPYQDITVTDDINTHQRYHRVTPDGEHLLIHTRLAYDPAADRDADADAYRWDEENGWICISCQLPGAPSGGDVELREVWLPNYATFFPYDFASSEPRYQMSEDGRRVFFGTPDALVPEDTNGEAGCPPVAESSESWIGPVPACTDVYEWHDGRVSLISDGASAHPARLMFSTASGRDVFFYTRERLVGWDKDDNVDIYDARIGGGFTEPAAQPPECEGDGCRGSGSETPAIAGAGSAVFQGPGNPKADAPANRCPAGKLRRGKRCLSPTAIARKRCRRIEGTAKRRCIRNQTRRLRRAQRRAKRRANTLRADFNRRASR